MFLGKHGPEVQNIPGHIQLKCVGGTAAPGTRPWIVRLDPPAVRRRDSNQMELRCTIYWTVKQIPLITVVFFPNLKNTYKNTQTQQSSQQAYRTAGYHRDPLCNLTLSNPVDYIYICMCVCMYTYAKKKFKSQLTFPHLKRNEHKYTLIQYAVHHTVCSLSGTQTRSLSHTNISSCKQMVEPGVQTVCLQQAHLLFHFPAL